MGKNFLTVTESVIVSLSLIVSKNGREVYARFRITDSDIAGHGISSYSLRQWTSPGGGLRAQTTTGDALSYLVQDHLNSTAITLNNTGVVTGEMIYSAWGERRYSFGATPTDRLYTGQYEAEAGLYFYNARWYDPNLGRFTQADSIIPEPGNPMAWDRYAYVYNNPIRNTDPSGYRAECGVYIGECRSVGAPEPEHMSVLKFVGDGWTQEAKDAFIGVANIIANRMTSTINYSLRKAYEIGLIEEYSLYTSTQLFLDIFGGQKTMTLTSGDGVAMANQDQGVFIYNLNWVLLHPRLIAHELGHVFNNILGKSPQTFLPYGLYRTPNGYGTQETGFNGFAGGQWDWQFSLPSQTHWGNEVFADMFLGWAYNRWANVPLGAARNNMMNTLMLSHLLTSLGY